ncbi:hypothetical protein [Pseudobutyrivibrio ruminis]|uniref:hypothetical protein n=1 Tax=Pseudobutyrivibrio ruminis TaxID=46206 RepID=UPI00051C478B|nr:hypothetical protein [Pseudobutyrivibrio ruminis]
MERWQTGLVNAADGSVYYAGSDGKLIAGQTVKIGGSDYLFGLDGKLVINQTIQIGTTLYQTDASGVVVASAPAAAAAPTK